MFNKIKFPMVAVVIASSLTAGCVGYGAGEMVEASCTHIDTSKSVGICIVDGVLLEKTALVPCNHILPEFRDLYLACGKFDLSSVDHRLVPNNPEEPEEPEEPVVPMPEKVDNDIEAAAHSSGTSAEINREDDELFTKACAGSTCVTFERD